MEYFESNNIRNIAEVIVERLGWNHIDLERVYFMRSRGSRSKNILARIHGFSRAWQKALSMNPHYIIEVIEEQFDKLNREEQEKVIIHELLHIPKSFRGGLSPHKNNITNRKVEKIHRIFRREDSM